MTRKIKALGLALVAAFAMSAVAASSASASHPFHFGSEEVHTEITGTQHAGEDVFTTNGGTVKCNTATYTATTNATKVTDITVTPHYTSCKAFGFINVPIDMDGCDYTFTTGTLETTAGGVEDYEGSVHIVCPGTGHEHAIRITAPGCEVTVPAQTPTGGKITFTNIGSGTTRQVTVDVALTGIHYTEHEISGFPNCNTETVTETNGTYNGSALITGKKTTGVQVGISVTKTV